MEICIWVSGLGFAPTAAHASRRPCFEQNPQGLYQSISCLVGTQSAVRLSSNSAVMVIIDAIHHSYMPGWDCHGLPIENKVLKTLGVRAFFLPISLGSDASQKEANDLEPTAIRSMADTYARQQVLSQAEQFSQFGIMADWDADSTYRTLGASCRASVFSKTGVDPFEHVDPDYEMRQLRVFQKMVERGQLLNLHLRTMFDASRIRSYIPRLSSSVLLSVFSLCPR